MVVLMSWLKKFRFDIAQGRAPVRIDRHPHAVSSKCGAHRVCMWGAERSLREWRDGHDHERHQRRTR